MNLKIFFFKLFNSFLFTYQKFLYYVLKSSDVLDILVPILYHLNDSRADQCKSFKFTQFTNINSSYFFF